MFYNMPKPPPLPNFSGFYKDLDNLEQEIRDNTKISDYEKLKLVTMLKTDRLKAMSYYKR